MTTGLVLLMVGLIVALLVRISHLKPKSPTRGWERRAERALEARREDKLAKVAQANLKKYEGLRGKE